MTHNVQWQSFITHFSPAWFEPHRIEVKLLELADRQGVAHTDLIKPQGCLFKETRQEACIGICVRAINLGCGVDVLAQSEIDSIVNIAPPSSWGRPMSSSECEDVHQRAVAFDKNRCIKLEELNDSDLALSVGVWDQALIRPKHAMAFNTKVDTRAIAKVTSSSRSHRDDALSVPPLGHLVVCSEAVRGQQLTNPRWRPFHRYLISAAQGVKKRMRCRYTAIGPDGDMRWAIGELDRIASGSGRAL